MIRPLFHHRFLRIFSVPPTISASLSPQVVWLALCRRADLWVLLISIAGGGLAAVSFGADHNWDLLNYHLYNPYAYLHRRYSFDLSPAQVQSYLNPVADLPFYVMVRFINNRPRLIAFALGACHGINFFLLFKTVRLVVDDEEPRRRALFQAAALAIGVTGAGALGLLGTTTNDLVGTIFILGALLACLSRSSNKDGGSRGCASFL